MKTKEIDERFDKEFPTCDCRNNLPPHFKNQQTNSKWVKDFWHKELSTLRQSVLEEVREGVNNQEVVMTKSVIGLDGKRHEDKLISRDQVTSLINNLIEEKK